MSSSSSSFQMFQLVLTFFISILLFMSTMQTISAASTSNINKAYKKFVKSACNSTTYPKICNKVLSPYAICAIQGDPQKLIYIALSATLNATRDASSSVKSVSKTKGLSPTEKQIVSDCAETTAEAIDELKDSLKAMAYLRGSDREAHMNDIRTWVSAALTNEFTCTDEFDGQNVRKSLEKKINKPLEYVAKLTSNCLALFNLIDR